MTRASSIHTLAFIPRKTDDSPKRGDDQLSQAVTSRVVLLTGSQIETTLCFMDGILRHHLPLLETYRLVLGTLAEVDPEKYDDDVVNQVLAFFRQTRPDFVFVSLIEFGLPRLSHLLAILRKQFNFVCVAGGPYAIEYPNACIEAGLFDVVNYSHGLSSWRIVANSKNLAQIPNIFYKSSDAVWVRNGPDSIAYSMDEVPKPYWGLDNLYLLVNPSWWNKTSNEKSLLCHMNR
jgi:hypothetical protein